MPWKSDLEKMNPIPEKTKCRKGKEANSVSGGISQPSLAAFLTKQGSVKADKQLKSPSPTKFKGNFTDDLEHRGLAKVIKVKEGQLVKTNLDTLTENVEAILINPRWNISGVQPARPDGTITTEDFAALHLSNKLMVDGLVFVWVEKEIISEMIRIMEKQDLTYVENVCWVMLDETKRKGKITFFLCNTEVDDKKTSDVSPAYIRDDS